MLKQKFNIYILAIKYWLFQCDEWKFAVEYAKALVEPWEVKKDDLK